MLEAFPRRPSRVRAAFALASGVALGVGAGGGCGQHRAVASAPASIPVAVHAAPDRASDAGAETSDACVERGEERACTRGEVEACVMLAHRFQDGRGARKDPARAAALYDKACSAGRLSACESLGYAYARGEGVGKDEARAARLFEQVCGSASDPDAGDDSRPRDCVPLADVLVSGRGIAKDEARAARIYELACDRGAFEVCFALATLVAQGRGVAKDPSRAADLLVVTCGNAFGLGCDEAAEMFRGRSGVAKDPARAKEMEDRAVAWAASACDMHGDVPSCERIAHRYARGVAPSDVAVAMGHLETACVRGVAEACRIAAGRYPPAKAATALARARDLADPSRTKAMLEKACDAGVLSDCFLLGEAYMRGDARWNVPKDVERGRGLVRASCPPDGDPLRAECRMAMSVGDDTAADASIAPCIAPGPVP
jgi:TPR repeat protein